GDPRHDGDRVSVPGRPGLRAVPARPPRRGAVAGPRAAGHGGADGLARDRGPGSSRRRADLAGGRAPSRGAHLLEQALAEGAEVSRPAARLAQAEALARSGRPDEATAEMRRAALEPVRS